MNIGDVAKYSAFVSAYVRASGPPLACFFLFFRLLPVFFLFDGSCLFFNVSC